MSVRKLTIVLLLAVGIGVFWIRAESKLRAEYIRVTVVNRTGEDTRHLLVCYTDANVKQTGQHPVGHIRSKKRKSVKITAPPAGFTVWVESYESYTSHTPWVRPADAPHVVVDTSVASVVLTLLPDGRFTVEKRKRLWSD